MSENGSLKRNNHYVPQMYLKGWHSNDNKKIFVYNLLVSDENVPAWREQSIARTASYNDLYIRVKQGVELDDVEKMFDQKVESVSCDALEKARNGQKLTTDSWDRLIDLMLAQAVRTPAFYHYSKATLIAMTKNSLEECMNELSKLKEVPKYIAENSDNDLIPLSLRKAENFKTEEGEVFEATTVVGKAIWQYAIKHVLAEESIVRQRFHKMHWSIVESSEDVHWPTSDNPFLYVSAEPGGIYKIESLLNSEGGISEKNKIFIFPISSQKALIAKSAGRYPARFSVNKEKALIIKELIVKNAFLQVYNFEPDTEIEQLRGRIIDLNEFNRIKNEYNSWHKKYLVQEGPYL